LEIYLYPKIQKHRLLQCHEVSQGQKVTKKRKEKEKEKEQKKGKGKEKEQKKGKGKTRKGYRKDNPP